MRRKLVKQGNNTLMISLPHTWIEHKGLKKGDEIEINEQSGGVYISTDATLPSREITLEITDELESSIRTQITNAYRAGFDTVKCQYKTTNQFKIIDDIVQTKLIGMEIGSSDAKSCTIQNITEPTQDHVRTMIDKIFSNIQSTVTALETNFSGKKCDEDIKSISDRVQKFDNFARRTICKQNTDAKNFFTWNFLQLLVHAQRELYWASKEKQKVPEAQLILSTIKQMIIVLEKSWKNNTTVELYKVHDFEKNTLKTKGKEILAKTKHPVIIAGLLQAGRLLYQANSPLQGMIMLQKPTSSQE